MSTALVGATDALASANAYAAEATSENTRRAYRADLKAFVAWCDRVGASAVPASAETCAAYLAHCADSGLKVATIQRRAAAIAFAHRLAGAASPLGLEAVKAVLRGVRRKLGVRALGKQPLTADLVAKVLKKCPATLAGARDRALIALGFAAALRRSELVALHVADVDWNTDGLILHICKSKTDQEGRGAEIAVLAGSRLKPAEALDDWIAASGLKEGPIFRAVSRTGRLGEPLSDRAAAEIVKRSVKRARLDPALFSGHSLRSGFVTSALERGADLFRVMDVTRHRRVETLRVYDRRAKAFKDHPGKAFL